MKKKILILEDDKIIQLLLGSYLNADYDTRIVGTLEDARHAVSNSNYDLIISNKSFTEKVKKALTDYELNVTNLLKGLQPLVNNYNKVVASGARPAVLDKIGRAHV